MTSHNEEILQQHLAPYKADAEALMALAEVAPVERTTTVDILRCADGSWRVWSSAGNCDYGNGATLAEAIQAALAVARG